MEIVYFRRYRNLNTIEDPHAQTVLEYLESTELTFQSVGIDLIPERLRTDVERIDRIVEEGAF